MVLLLSYLWFYYYCGYDHYTYDDIIISSMKPVIWSLDYTFVHSSQNCKRS